MAVILSLETSTDVCSVALHDDNELIQELVVKEPHAHAAQLAPLIQKIINQAGRTLSQIDAVAVSSGPGSYTGLRIGTSTAKGICFALNKPLIAVPTLEIIAYASGSLGHECFICSMLDARRMEVYCQVFDEKLNVVTPVEAVIVNQDSFNELLDQRRVLFVGNGADKCSQVINHTNAIFVREIIPAASAVGILATRKFLQGAIEDLSAFTPFYLKEFVAKKSKSLI